MATDGFLATAAALVLRDHPVSWAGGTATRTDGIEPARGMVESLNPEGCWVRTSGVVNSYLTSLVPGSQYRAAATGLLEVCDGSECVDQVVGTAISPAQLLLHPGERRPCFYQDIALEDYTEQDLAAGETLELTLDFADLGFDYIRVYAKVWVASADVATVTYCVRSGGSVYSELWYPEQSKALTDVYHSVTPYIFQPWVIEKPGVFTFVVEVGAGGDGATASVYYEGVKEG